MESRTTIVTVQGFILLKKQRQTIRMDLRPCIAKHLITVAGRLDTSWMLTLAAN